MVRRSRSAIYPQDDIGSTARRHFQNSMLGLRACITSVIDKQLIGGRASPTNHLESVAAYLAGIVRREHGRGAQTLGRGVYSYFGPFERKWLLRYLSKMVQFRYGWTAILVREPRPLSTTDIPCVTDASRTRCESDALYILAS